MSVTKPKPRRYIPTQHTPDEAAHFMMLADDLAAWCSGVLAGISSPVMRRGSAHRYLIMAHLILYADGAGDDAALELLADLERGMLRVDG